MVDIIVGNFLLEILHESTFQEGEDRTKINICPPIRIVSVSHFNLLGK